MSAEINEANTQIVYNPRSGASSVGHSTAAAIAEELRRLVPQMPRYSFDDILHAPEKMDRPNTIVIGGDGSAAETAKRIPGTIFPFDGSTSGVIQKSSGFKLEPFEVPAAYTDRVMKLLMSGSYEIQRIAQGEIHRAMPFHETPLPFVFRTGLGAPGRRYLESMESLRGKLPNRLRVFAGLVRTLIATTDAQIFSVVHDGKDHGVLDAQIYKIPFVKSRMILTPDPSRNVMITMNALPHPSRIPRLIMDAYMIMILRQQPTFGGISAIPLSPDAPVFIHTPKGMASSFQVDGEKQKGTPVRIYGSKNSGIVYQFASIASS